MYLQQPQQLFRKGRQSIVAIDEPMLEIMGSGPTLFQRDSSILLVAYGFFCVEILTNCNAGLYRVLEKVLEVLDQD